MRWISIGLAMLLAAGQLAAAEPPGLGRRFEQPIVDGALDARLFDEAVAIVSNAAREAHGLRPLKRDGKLTRAATGHALSMAQLRRHSHRLPVPGRAGLAQRMDGNGVRYRTAGENIGMEKVLRLLGRPVSTPMRGCDLTYADTGGPVPVHTYATLAQSAVARWMASPAHRASLLSATFRRIGSGVGIDAKGPACGDVYLVQNFAD